MINFSCENFIVFGLNNISVVENPWSEFFSSENMATGDSHDCENKKLIKYDFMSFADSKIILEKIIFHDVFIFLKYVNEKMGNLKHVFFGKIAKKYLKSRKLRKNFTKT